MFTSAELGDAILVGNCTKGEEAMPKIIVTADGTTDQENGAVMLRERINVTDFESDHFATLLVERLGWAVGDAAELERTADEKS
jgi:hypothetical protein